MDAAVHAPRESAVGRITICSLFSKRRAKPACACYLYEQTEK